MGDIVDMMLDGTICAGCGEFLDGDGDGFPIYCSGCSPDDDEDEAFAEPPKKEKKYKPIKKWACGVCGKKFLTVQSLKDHHKGKHPELEDNYVEF